MKTIVSLSVIASVILSNTISSQNELACAVELNRNIMHAEQFKDSRFRRADSVQSKSVAYPLSRIEELKKVRVAIDSQIIAFFENSKTLTEENLTGDEMVRKQIEGSEFCGRLWNQLFDHNKEVIKLILHSDSNAALLMNESILALMRDATRNILSSREMRREARAEKIHAARLASLINAEEKEYTALKLQEQILKILASVDQSQMLTGN